MSAPRVSLLLPNYNNEQVLGVVLDRLAANTTLSGVELVIVDDGSTDSSPSLLKAWRDSGEFQGEVQLIEKPNSGAIDSLNTALNAAEGEMCVQLDSDASIETHGWLEKMLGLMDLDERVGVVTAKVVMDSGDLHACGVNVTGPAGWHDRSSIPQEPIGRRRWHHRVDRVREGHGGHTEMKVAEVDAGIGCCMMYRRADALAAGGYDTNFSPVWFDDVDLCISIRRLGRKVFYLPDVRVIHHLQARHAAQAPGSRITPGRIGRALVRRGARRAPPRVRNGFEQRFGVDLDMHFTKDQLDRLEHHYGYWQSKWGWDARNPDQAEVSRRWGGTEVCWAMEPEQRQAGEAIVRAAEERRRAPAS